MRKQATNHLIMLRIVEFLFKQNSVKSSQRGFIQFILILVLTTAINSLKSQSYVSGSVTIFGSTMLAGNVVFDASSRVEIIDGAEIIITGDSTTLEPGAEIYANISPSLTGTGSFSFEGNSGQQILNGGNSATSGNTQPVLINITINNPNGLGLYGNNARVNNDINFLSGHLFLNDQNLELAQGGTLTNTTQNAYVVTNGNGALLTEGINPSSTFIFPVGRAVSDYTPVEVTNLSAGNDNYYVRVRNYTESSSNELVTDDGIDRSWNIYSDNGTNARIALQHNNATNGITFVNADGFVTRQNNSTTAEWMLGPPLLTTGNPTYDGAGSIAGSEIHSRDFNLLSTVSTADQAWFSVSSNPSSPLPVSMNFVAKWLNSDDANLQWELIDADKVVSTDIYRSYDGTNWRKLGEVSHASYAGNYLKAVYTDRRVFAALPEGKKVYYKLNLNYENKKTEPSPVRILYRNNTNGLALLYPNPTAGNLSLVLPSEWNSGEYLVEIFDGTGKQIFSKTVVKNSGIVLNEQILTGKIISPGTYVLRVSGQGENQHNRFIQTQ